MYNIIPNVNNLPNAPNIKQNRILTNNRTPHTLKLHHSTFPSDKTCGVKT